MKAELKTKWVQALRSGDYKQTKGELRDFDRDHFCCLGVLCEVAAVPRIDADCGYNFNDPLQSDEALIYGPLSDGLPQVELSHMNDSGKSFAEIADWIEANIPTEAA